MGSASSTSTPSANTTVTGVTPAALTGLASAVGATPAIGGAETASGGYSSSSTASPYYTAPSSPSVLSGSTIREDVIPPLDNEATTTLYNGTSSTGTNGNGNIINGVSGVSSTDDNTPAVPSSGSTSIPTLPDNPTTADLTTYLNDLNSSQSLPLSQDPNTAAAYQLIQSARSENDAQLNTTLDQIQSQYTQLLNTKQQSDAASTAGLQKVLINGGSDRYAPVSSSGIMSAKTTADLNDLADLENKESQLISSAQNAHSAQDYKLLDSQMTLLTQQRADKNALATKISNDLATQLNTENTNKIQAQRDSSIAALVQEGITDPTEILDNLNYDSKGNEIGDYTAAEIESTLKNLSPTGDLTGLSGSVKDFYALQGSGKLPASVAAMAPGDQLAGYLTYIKNASTTTTRSGAPKTITLSDAKTNGLPLSVVGLTEQDISNSFYDVQPPQWFTEKLQNETGTTTDPTTLQNSWTQYRNAYLSSAKSSTTKVPPSIIGKVKALKAQNASGTDISDFITYSGYDPGNPIFGLTAGSTTSTQ